MLIYLAMEKLGIFKKSVYFSFCGALNNINNARKLITMPVLEITQN